MARSNDPRGLDETTNAGDARTTEAAQAPQQQANSGAQQAAAARPRSRMTKDANGNEIPFNPAPRAHATESLTFLAARGQQQFRNRENPGIPTMARPEAKASAKWQPMPAGGIAALADSLFPDDLENPDAMHQHIFDLMLLNNDLVRDDTSHSVGQLVRIPG